MSKFAGLGLAVDTPFIVRLVHPISGVPLINKETNDPATISILGADSEAALRFNREILTRRLSARNRRVATADEIETERVELLARLTKAWVLVDLDGNGLSIECNESNARELYASPPLRWLREQVEAAIDDRGNAQRA